MTQHKTFDARAVHEQFPILQRPVHGHELVYLDSAASSQKPESVIAALDRYYRETNANVHRGVYALSEAATEAYEGGRRKVARFINAKSSREVIFTRNTTESINLVAYSWGRSNLRPGDEILLTMLEHHSNLVPWQLIGEQTGAKLRFIPMTENGTLALDSLDELLTERTRLVAFTAMSNVLGTITPAKEIIRRAHTAGALTLVDGAQSVPHLRVDVQDLDCDFLAFSGHKMCGPTGIGVLYGKRALLEEMPPFLGGGDMIRTVHLQESTWNDLPWKFEAGTPAIAQGVGMGAAVDFLSELGMDAVREHERELTAYALEALSEVEGLTLYGPPAEQRGGVASFNLAGIHPHDVASILDREGIAVRAGHHCAQPLMDCLGVHATTRASFYVYNTREDVDRLVKALYITKQVFDF